MSVVVGMIGQESLIDAEADFDADYEEVQAVRKREAQASLARANLEIEPELGEHVTGYGGGENED